jgi:hypothetical protein
MAYSFYILPSLSETQKEKFLSGINPTVVDDGLDDWFYSQFSKAVSQAVRRRSVTYKTQPMVTYQGSPEKKAPRLFGRKSVRQCDNILDDFQVFNTDGGRYLYTKYTRLFEPLLVGASDRRTHLDVCKSNTDSLESRFGPTEPATVRGGEIHFLQEPGGKLRSVASPFRLYQQALQPLGRSIYDIVRVLPWDCTFDQSKAIPIIQSHLSQGGVVSSVDLSSATDHFPLSIQVIALKAIFEEKDWDHVNLFAEISRGTWKSPLGDLRWSKGQPLGLYPSFGAFTLTHGLLLYYLNGCRHDNQFFVVGDDVVILDSYLSKSYKSMLDRMSCPWSEDKSITSNKLSEFAGKVITPTMVIPQLKWRKISDDNFLDICRLLGSRSRHLLSDRQKNIFDQVSHLCEPIGLNFSLPGDNLERMIQRTMEFYNPENVVLASLMGLRRKLNLLVHTSSENLDAIELQELSATFDEKVKSALSRTIFNRWESSLLIGLEGFETMPQALGISPRLPLRDKQPSRVTTLQRYERTLNH